jgi:hypothetical protein
MYINRRIKYAPISVTLKINYVQIYEHQLVHLDPQFTYSQIKNTVTYTETYY